MCVVPIFATADSACRREDIGPDRVSKAPRMVSESDKLSRMLQEPETTGTPAGGLSLSVVSYGCPPARGEPYTVRMPFLPVFPEGMPYRCSSRITALLQAALYRATSSKA